MLRTLLFYQRPNTKHMCGHMATQIWFNIDAGNDLPPDGTKPSPEHMLTYHRWGILWHSIYNKLFTHCLRYQSINIFENYTFSLAATAPWTNELCFITNAIRIIIIKLFINTRSDQAIFLGDMKFPVASTQLCSQFLCFISQKISTKYQPGAKLHEHHQTRVKLLT